MLSGDVEKLYPSAKALVKDCVASRIHAKDASLYDFSEEARACSEPVSYTHLDVYKRQVDVLGGFVERVDVRVALVLGRVAQVFD